MIDTRVSNQIPIETDLPIEFIEARRVATHYFNYSELRTHRSSSSYPITLINGKNILLFIVDDNECRYRCIMEIFARNARPVALTVSNMYQEFILQLTIVP